MNTLDRARSALVLPLLLVCGQLHTNAQSVWNGNDSDLWNHAGNWSSGIPGSGDTALFNGLGNGNTTIDLGAGVTVSVINFESASVVSYTLGSGALNSQTLTLNDGGSINLDSAVAASQLVNAALQLGLDGAAASYTLSNASTTNSLTLAGDITGGPGGSAGAKTLNVNGEGAILLNGGISNGGASSLAISKSDAGLLTLAGDNDFTGGVTVNAGATVAASHNNALGMGTLTLTGTGATLAIGDGVVIGNALSALNPGNAKNITLVSGATAGEFAGSISIGESGAGNFVLNANGGVLTISGTIGASAGANITVTNTGGGTVIVSGNNAGFDQNVTVNAQSVLRAANNAAFGPSTNTITITGTNATFELADGIDIGNAFIAAGVGNNKVLRLQDGATSATYSGAITNNEETDRNFDLNASAGGTLTVSGQISGSGAAIEKTGAGNVNLSGDNAGYAGGFALSGGGTLNIAHANALGSGLFDARGNGSFDNTTGSPLALANAVAFSNGSPTFIGSNDMSFSGLLTISGANRTITVTAGSLTFSGGTADDGSGRTLTKAGDGALTLSGAGGHTGGTTLSAGTLNIAHAQALGSGAFTISSGNTTFDNTAGSALTIANNLALNGNPTFTGSDHLTIEGAVTMNNNRNITVSDGVLTLSGAVGQTGGDRNLTKAGGGTLELLSVSSDFSGQMLLNAGTLVVFKLADTGDNSSIGTGAGTGASVIRIGNGNNVGTMDYIGSGDSTDRQVQIGNGTAANSNGNAVIRNNGSGPVIFTNAAFNTAQGDAVNTASRFLVLGGANTDDNEIQGAIIDNATAVHLRKEDAGTWILSGSNTFTGATEVNSGLLQFSGDNTSATGSVTVSGGILKLGHNNAIAGTGSLAVNGGSLDINGTISTIAAGNLALGGTTTASVIDSAGGGLFTLQGNIVYGGGGGSWTQAFISADLDLGGATRSINVTSGGSAVDLEISGVISGDAHGIIKGNAGILRLTGLSTYGGQTVINNGVVQVNTLANAGSDSSLGTGDDNAVIQIGTNTNTGTLEFIGTAGAATDRQIQIGVSSNNSAHVGGSTILNNGTGALVFSNPNFNNPVGTGTNEQLRTLALGGVNTEANTIQGVIQDNAGTNKVISLLKQDAGTWILSGDNTYTGTTTVDGGTLVINGNQSAATGAVTIAAGATLAGSGTIGGATTIFGTHSPGNSPDLQIFASDLAYEADAIFEWELFSNTVSLSDRGNGTTGWDAVNVGGDLAFINPVTLSLVFNGAGSTVNWTEALWSTDQQWLVWSHTGLGLTSGLGNVFISTQNWLDGSGNSFDSELSGSFFDLFQSGQDVYLRYNLIPEPSRALLVLIGCLGMILRRRR